MNPNYSGTPLRGSRDGTDFVGRRAEGGIEASGVRSVYSTSTDHFWVVAQGSEAVSSGVAYCPANTSVCL